MMRIGSHVKMSGKEMFLGAAKEAVSYGANTFMLYTGAPQNTKRKEISELNIEAGLAFMKEQNIDDIVVHAPYIINLANSIKPSIFRLAVDFLASELKRTEALNSKLLVLHSGSHVDAGVEIGINKIIEGLNAVLTQDTKVNIVLETMAGKGSEIGKSFDELKKIYDGVKYNDKLRICFDTCHVHDAGYDIVGNLEGVMEEFDKAIGINQIAVIHVNDSKNERGMRKDRHENIGFGKIGYTTLHNIVFHKDLENAIKIVETPYIDAIDDKNKSFPPYKYEIQMLKDGKFDENLMDKIRNQSKE